MGRAKDGYHLLQVCKRIFVKSSRYLLKRKPIGQFSNKLVLVPWEHCRQGYVWHLKVRSEAIGAKSEGCYCPGMQSAICLSPIKVAENILRDPPPPVPRHLGPDHTFSTWSCNSAAIAQILQFEYPCNCIFQLILVQSLELVHRISCCC